MKMHDFKLNELGHDLNHHIVSWVDAASLLPGACPGFSAMRCLGDINFSKQLQIDQGQNRSTFFSQLAQLSAVAQRMVD
jgi:hypothetical protein